MTDLSSIKEKVTAEQLMLVTFLVVSAVFIIEPIVEGYPDDARVFPQLTASAVFIGAMLLLLQNYLPGPVRKFVAESISITGGSSTDVAEEVADESTTEEPAAEEDYKKDTLGAKYGYEVNDTWFMVSTAVLYFVVGWAAGFLFATPLYILGYTLWFRINPLISVGIAVLGTAIIFLFMTYLILPFDQGHIFDFSPLIPMFLDASPTLLRGDV
jgi:hypothetical protein